MRFSGRDFYLGKFDDPKTHELYRRVIAEWLLTGNTPESLLREDEAPPFSINELILAYWNFSKQHYRKNGEPTSELGLIQDTLKVLRDLYGSLPVSEFGPLCLKAVREVMIHKGWVRTEINKKGGRIRRCFRWGVENELVPAEIFYALEAVAGLQHGRSEAKESQPILPVSEDDVNAVLVYLPRQVRDMVRLQLLCGCRPGEIVSLKAGDVDCSGDVWEYVPESHKTEHHGRTRIIFFGPRAQVILEPYLKRPLDQPCFSPAEAEVERKTLMRKDRKSPVQPSQQDRSCGSPQKRPGEAYTTDSYRRAINRACRKAKIEPWAPNRLRHSSATHLRKQFGVEAAQVVLGHADLKVTQVYAERDFSAAKAIMAEVGY